MLRWSRKRKGFTLVELVIVIAILGILAMYALPKYQGLIKEARSSEARAQLGSFRSALGIYYAKNHGKFPTYTCVNEGDIFADGRVPEVEVTVSGTVERNNKVTAAGTPDGSIKETEITNTGGWMYDVNSGHDTADVRLNSTDKDEFTGYHWYEY